MLAVPLSRVRDNSKHIFAHYFLVVAGTATELCRNLLNETIALYSLIDRRVGVAFLAGKVVERIDCTLIRSCALLTSGQWDANACRASPTLSSTAIDTSTQQ